ncbi:MAG: hypothetical protein NTW74_25855 [Acidobacteria bacterium]|nr:hypothetical protein [Acidobacteriota bacterium]
MQLLVGPAKLCRPLLAQSLNQGQQDTVILLQGLLDAARRQIQLGQTPAAVFHLFEKFEHRLASAFGWPEQTGSRSGGDANQRLNLSRLKT